MTKLKKEAEEYAKRTYVLEQDSLHARIEAYIAGAKAHLPQWHDLRKNPFDLPTHPYRVLVLTDEGVGFGIYGLDNKRWYTYDTGFDVIEWTEILLPE